MIVVLCGAAALGMMPMLSVGFDFEKIYSEGWNAYHASRAAAGEVLYSGDPWRLVNYPFLSFYLIGWLKPLFADVLTIGRALNLMGLAAVIFGSAAVVLRLGGRPLDAGFGAACVLAYQAIQAPAWIGSDDPQMLAEAFMIAGLVWYLHDHASVQRLAVAAMLLGIGGFTKHNLVAIPAAITIDVWRNNRQAFWVWCGLGATTFLALTGLTYVAAGGDFFHELTAPRVLRNDLLAHTKKFVIHFKLPLLLTVIYLASPAPRREATLLRSYGLVSLAAAVIFSAGEGTSYNIFLDVTVFLGIVAGLALHRWRQWLNELGGIGKVAAILLPLVVAQPVTTRLSEITQQLLHVPNNIHNLFEQQRQFRAAAQILREHDGEAMCESLLLCFEAGKPLLVDPYNARQMILTGRMTESSLIDDIERHRFRIIQMPATIYRDPAAKAIDRVFLTPPRFTENTLSAIERYYEPGLTGGGVVFYRPKAK